MASKLIFLATLSFTAFCVPAFADPIKVAAAENFYGDVANQIGGANLAVTSIITNPDEDPHLFEASTETLRALTDAKVVVANRAGYDNWMNKLLNANQAPGREEINVGQLVGRHAGENPHLRYDPAYVKAAARALTAALIAVDPAHRADYERGEGLSLLLFVGSGERSAQPPIRIDLGYNTLDLKEAEALLDALA